jgi:RES domain
MSIQSYIEPWNGNAVRHIPKLAVGQYDIYDFSYAGRSAENRWNFQGEPTLYLAKEKADAYAFGGALPYALRFPQRALHQANVALAEYARHFKIDRTPQLAQQAQQRAVYRFNVQLEQVVNLCQPEVWQELSLTNAPDCFKDRDVARACANFIRYTTTATAIFVPSMAFLDNLEQWCLVLFLEKLPPDVREFLPSVNTDGTFMLE